VPTFSRWDTLNSMTDERSFIEPERQHDGSEVLAVIDRLADKVNGHRRVQLKRVKGHALVERVHQQTFGRCRRKRST